MQSIGIAVSPSRPRPACSQVAATAASRGRHCWADTETAGLSLRHRRGHLLRAAYEGIAFGMRQILEGSGVVQHARGRIVAVGGGTRARLWTRIVSDVTRPTVMQASCNHD